MNNKVLLAVGIVFVLIIIGVSIYFMVKKSSSPTKTITSTTTTAPTTQNIHGGAISALSGILNGLTLSVV